MDIIIVIVILLLYLFCYYIASYGRFVSILCSSLIFSVVFLYYIFGGYLIPHYSIYDINIILILVGFIFFFTKFSLFSYLMKYGFYGVVLHATTMCLIHLLDIVPPLTPLIMLYSYIPEYLPKSAYPSFNMFVLYLVPAIIFYGVKISYCGLPVFFIISIIFLSFYFNNSTSMNEGTRVKVAVIQVGLYVEKNGGIISFFDDLLSFLKDNPDVDIVVFSENNIFTYKDIYNISLSEKLIDIIRVNSLTDKHHLLLSFNGFNAINNVVTVYMHQHVKVINQKESLIPFIEKKGFFNKKEDILSEYFWVDTGLSNQILRIKKYPVRTSICYDSLFPDFISERAALTIVQSNYQLLDKGNGFERLQKLGGILSKFSIGANSNILINIQSSGGTIFIDRNWKVDEDVYFKSKKEPFVIIDIFLSHVSSSV
ncbi:hypothetical protein DMN43_22865 [Escherichia coli]|nr:hypothetical protein [Escherichia coli]